MCWPDPHLVESAGEAALGRVIALAVPGPLRLCRPVPGTRSCWWSIEAGQVAGSLRSGVGSAGGRPHGEDPYSARTAAQSCCVDRRFLVQTAGGVDDLRRVRGLGRKTPGCTGREAVDLVVAVYGRTCPPRPRSPSSATGCPAWEVPGGGTNGGANVVNLLYVRFEYIASKEPPIRRSLRCCRSLEGSVTYHAKALGLPLRRLPQRSVPPTS
jgi:hypothetical protein